MIKKYIFNTNSNMKHIFETKHGITINRAPLIKVSCLNFIYVNKCTQ